MSLSAAARPASTREALAMLTSALGYLAAADATQMPASEQAECLAGLERADAIETAARASILGGFTAAKGYCEDADYSPRAWLIHKTRITKGAAAGHIAWVRRSRAHPRIAAALAAAEITAAPRTAPGPQRRWWRWARPRAPRPGSRGPGSRAVRAPRCRRTCWSRRARCRGCRPRARRPRRRRSSPRCGA